MIIITLPFTFYLFFFMLKYEKQTEKLKKGPTEMSKILSRCHMLLNENIEQLETLNNMLPVEERLEPFVWTTG